MRKVYGGNEFSGLVDDAFNVAEGQWHMTRSASMLLMAQMPGVFEIKDYSRSSIDIIYRYIRLLVSLSNYLKV